MNSEYMERKVPGIIEDLLAADPEPNCILDPASGRFLFVNEAQAKIFGYPPEQFLEADLGLISPPDLVSDREVRERLERAVHDGHARFDWTCRSQTGCILHGEFHLVRFAMNEQTWLRGNLRFTDVPDGMETALRESEERYRSVISAMAEGVVLQSQAGEILTCNESAERILGLSKEQMTGRTSIDSRWRSVREDGSPFPGPEHPSMITLQTGRACSGVIMGVHKPSGDLTWISINSEPLHRPGESEPFAVVTSFHDLTDRKQAERELAARQAEIENLNSGLEVRIKEEVEKNRQKDVIMLQQSRHAAMGEMISNIAHQWRQPLSALRQILFNIKDGFAYEDLTEEQLDKDLGNATLLIMKMSSTIDDFRDFFEPNRTKKHFAPADVVKEVLALIQPDLEYHGIKVETRFVDSIRLRGYANEYSQVLLNVLKNSRDAILERRKDDGRIEIHLREEARCGVLRIRDNGPGIPENVFSRIFDPYFTTREEGKGTGIGLYMSRLIIQDHMEGGIEARNTSSGTEFTIAVPLAADEPESPPE